MVTIQIGHSQYETMTVGELIEHLRAFDTALPVIAHWEGQIKTIEPENVQITDDGDIVGVLFDVDP